MHTPVFGPTSAQLCQPRLISHLKDASAAYIAHDWPIGRRKTSPLRRGCLDSIRSFAILQFPLDFLACGKMRCCFKQSRLIFLRPTFRFVASIRRNKWDRRPLCRRRGRGGGASHSPPNSLGRDETHLSRALNMQHRLRRTIAALLLQTLRNLPNDGLIGNGAHSEAHIQG